MKFSSFARLFGTRRLRGSSSHRQRLRKTRTPQTTRLLVEGLESRELLAVLPTPTVLNHQLLSVTSGGNQNTPSVAVDPTNPLKAVAVWTRNDPQLPAPTTVILEGAYTNNGGASWQPFPGTFPFTRTIDFASAVDNPQFFAQQTDGTVAFDRFSNVYVLYSNHAAGNATGELLLSKFNFGGAAPALLFTTTVYQWTTEPAFNPTLAVDNTLASDPTNPGQLINPNSGNVYVAWNQVNVAPNPAIGGFNPNVIKLVVSSDGGATFSPPALINGFSNSVASNFSGDARYSLPRLVVSQGTSDGRIAPGQVLVTFVDFNSGRQLSPPRDFVLRDVLRDTDGNQVLGTALRRDGPGAGINDGFDPGGGAPHIPGTTVSTITLNASDLSPRFTTLSDIDITVSMLHPALQELSLELIAPDGTVISLFRNRTDAAGQTPPFNPGITGANLGTTTVGRFIGTIFDDEAPRSIRPETNGAQAPFTGHFRTELQQLRNLYGRNRAAMIGDWRLRIRDFRAANTGFLIGWSMSLVSDLNPGADSFVTSTTVLGANASPFPLTATVSPDRGIGPGVSLAVDNTLGGPFAGRVYLAYTDRINVQTNPADNTDIFLLASDNGGTTWFNPLAGGQALFLNDDLATRDGFSEHSPFSLPWAGRPQFLPELAVDAFTGTLVASWYDARHDAARARVARYFGVSIDGGASFSSQTYLNRPHVVIDAIEGSGVVLGPIPDNLSSGNVANAGLQQPGRDTAFGYGDRQAMAALGGRIYTLWAGNENGGVDGRNRTGIYFASATFASGPRIVASDMGPVFEDRVAERIDGTQLPYNNTFTLDGRRQLDAFVVTFDRPVDPATFGPDDVTVIFRRPISSGLSPGDRIITGNSVGDRILSVEPLDQQPFGPAGVVGATRFLVRLTPQSEVGTYSYLIGPDIRDRIVREQIVLNPVRSFSQSSTNVPLPIPDLTTIQSQLTINATPEELVARVQVTLNLTHTFTSDLIITLIAPDGTRVILANRRGFNGQNFTNTTFDDQAQVPISAGTAPFTGIFRPDQPLGILFARPAAGTWLLEVADVAGLDSGTLLSWSLTIETGTLAAGAVIGNPMDQDNDGIFGEPGSDVYAAPRPLNPATFNGTDFRPPYDSKTLPLIIPGPYVIGTRVLNANLQPPTTGSLADTENLILNSTVRGMDVVFDRDMDASSFVAGSVLRVLGPAGQISGPFQIVANPLGTDPDPRNPRTFRIIFPEQRLSGTYTIILSSTIRDRFGNLLDTNRNAGLDPLRGENPRGTTIPTTFSENRPAVIPAGTPAAPTTTRYSIAVNQDFLVRDTDLTLNITHPSTPLLSAVLIAPNGARVTLFDRLPAPGANFTDTVFDDGSPLIGVPTSITNGSPPYNGRFRPQQIFASVLNGINARGNWDLEITNRGAPGSLVRWSLTLRKDDLSVTGLGELVADQATVHFRIFSMAPDNAQSISQWTAVGGAALGVNQNTGRFGGLAVDPSDPSGNTVFAAGASGGIWKTTNFLTADPQGPTWVPLTDFGPTFSLSIKSIAVFPRNNDPRQTIIFAGTGEGATLGRPGDGVEMRGVGFLRSMDGGATWTLLDSRDNRLPFNHPNRDHWFARGFNYSFKVIVDPRPTLDGKVIVYAALGGSRGGIWRSLDTGDTWELMRAGEATDVVFDKNSGTFDAISNPAGNLQTLYAAFAGEGVFITPNRGVLWTQLLGNVGNPLRRDANLSPSLAVPVTNPTQNPNGPKQRISLVTPELTGTFRPDGTYDGDVNRDILYQGWLYALVSNPDDTLDGLYVTKDFGRNWTYIRIPTVFNSAGLPIPSNDTTRPDFEVLGQIAPQGNYDQAIAIDPNNPRIIYVGGQGSNVIRVDTTGLGDAHAFYQGHFNPDGGVLQVNATSPVTIKSPVNPPLVFGYPNIIGDPRTEPHLNLQRNPSNPFGRDATIYVSNTAAFTNPGSGVTWKPINQVSPTSGDFHHLLAIRDPLTKLSRLILADDHSINTGIDFNGEFLTSLGVEPGQTRVDPVLGLVPLEGNVPLAFANRTGNLQLNQHYYGAAQPGNMAAVRNSVEALRGMYYGHSQDTGFTNSVPDVLETGNITWTGLLGGVFNFQSTQVNLGDGGGVATDPGGSGTVYQYKWPCCGGRDSDFFQVNGVGRTFGLLQAGDDPANNIGQWRDTGIANFAVNPLFSQQIVISSFVGRIFMTTNEGRFWLPIGEPGVLDGTQARAMAYGAPRPGDPVGSINNFIYVGTEGGNIFVTTTGGGSWTNISAGLDGSPVRSIITNPNRGSREAYAVTHGGTLRSYAAGFAAPADAIASNATATFGLNVPDNVIIENLAVTVNLTHPNVSELRLTVVAPDGRRIRLKNFGQVGGANFTGTTFDDEALVALGGPAPFTGTFLPAERIHHYGRNANGLWQLIVENGPSAGTLQSWGLTLRVAGGVWHIPDATAGQPWRLLGTAGQLFRNQADAFQDPSLRDFLPRRPSSIVADWRYRIPDDLSQLSNINYRGPTHPVLYVGTSGGVYRTFDQGATWEPFPNISIDGATRDGGWLPNTQVTDLDLSLGNIDPTTGRPRLLGPDGQPDGTATLLATTFGRGSFAIRLAPVVLAQSLRLSPTLPDRGPGRPSGSDTGTVGDRITNELRPVIEGLTMESAFGNRIRVEIVNLDDPNQPIIGTAFSDVHGRFQVQVNEGVFRPDGSSDGLRTLGIRAVDDIGTLGPIARFQFTIDTTPILPPVPPGPLPPPNPNDPEDPNNAPGGLRLSPTLPPPGGSDSGLSLLDRITNVAEPVFVGQLTQASPVTVNLFDITDPNAPRLIGTAQTDADGAYQIATPAGFYANFPDGARSIRIQAVNPGGRTSQVDLINYFVLDRTAPGVATVALLADSDSPIGSPVRDNITNVRTPTFFGRLASEPGALVTLFRRNVAGGDHVPIGSAIINPSGDYTITVSPANAFQDGTYEITVVVTDVAGNVGPRSAPMQPLLVIRTTLPAVPTLVLDPSTNTGSLSDNITAAIPQLYTGTNEAGLSLTITINGVVIGTFDTTRLQTPQIVRRGGAIFATYTQLTPTTFQVVIALTDGTHVLRASNADVAGNTSTSADLVVRIDREALDPDRKFIREIYQQALGRPGSLAEWNLWVPLLSVPQGRFLVANGIERSEEARRLLVSNWYQFFLGRRPGGNEEQAWVAALMAGFTEEEVIAGILGSDEYFARAPRIPGVGGTVGNDAFIRALYLQLLGRNPLPGEVPVWLGVLPSVERTQVAKMFLTSVEYRSLQVIGYYVSLLRRPTLPSEAEVAAWVFSDLDLTSIRIGFEASPEFYSRVTGFRT